MRRGHGVVHRRAGLVLALAAVRRSLTRAFCFSSARGGRSSGGGGLVRGKKSFRAAGAAESLSATPPESPFPSADDDLVSFFLLRHGQTNFNAIGRIQVIFPGDVDRALDAEFLERHRMTGTATDALAVVSIMTARALSMQVQEPSCAFELLGRANCISGSISVCRQWT